MNIQVNRTSEKWLERALQDYVTDCGGAAVKLCDGAKNGLPDRLILWPDGRAEFVELKSTGEKLRPLQIIVRNKLLELGFRYTVIDSETALRQWQISSRGLIRLR